MIKLLIGGSPCTHWSIAQTKNRETKPEGLGWELFKNYLVAKEKYKPDYFLYENNKSAARSIKDQISKELGVDLQYINSALVSAQNRERFYAHNIPAVSVPEDRGILLRDILETEHTDREKSYVLDVSYYKAHDLNLYHGKHQQQLGLEEVSFGVAMRTREDATGKYKRVEPRKDNKANALTTVITDSMVCSSVRIGTIENNMRDKNYDSKQYRVYSPDGKSVTICGQGGGLGAKTGLYAVPLTEHGVYNNSNNKYTIVSAVPVYEVQNGIISIKGTRYPVKLSDGLYIIRKLTVTECKRLQTVPDDYLMPCSASQNYKMLGNGWTVDVIVHILSHIPNITQEPIEVLSMYDGMSCGRIALDKLGASVSKYYATEIDKYCIKTSLANYPDIVQLGDAFQVRDSAWRL